MKIFRYEITDSTNTRAREYAKLNSIDEPVAFIADGQSAGRGRKGRSFDSEKGAGLYISFLFRPNGDADFVGITVKAAVAVAKALETVFGLSVGIKWVNDIFIGERKLAGILAEGEFDQGGNLSYAVCGIGVNLLKRKFPPDLADIVTTVEDNIGEKPNRDALAEALASEFFKDTDYAQILEEYRRRSVILGKRIEVRRISGESFFAKAIEISDTGALVVLSDTGERLELISAEVSLNIT